MCTSLWIRSSAECRKCKRVAFSKTFFEWSWLISKHMWCKVVNNVTCVAFSCISAAWLFLPIKWEQRTIKHSASLTSGAAVTLRCWNVRLSTDFVWLLPKSGLLIRAGILPTCPIRKNELWLLPLAPNETGHWFPGCVSGSLINVKTFLGQSSIVYLHWATVAPSSVVWSWMGWCHLKM